MIKQAIFLFAASLLLSGCQSGGPSSQATSDSSASSSAESDPYVLSTVCPQGIPALSFYDKGNDTDHFLATAPANIGPAFANDNQDAIVFPGLSGLKNIKANSRNYVLSDWISEGTFYVVSTKHADASEYAKGQTILAFGKEDNAGLAFRSIMAAKNWSEETVTWQPDVASVGSTLAPATFDPENAYDYYLLAQPVYFRMKAGLKKAKNIDLNLIFDVQAEWGKLHDGHKIPAAALFLNKSTVSAHPNSVSAYRSELQTRLKAAKNDDGVSDKMLELYENDDNAKAKFGFTVSEVKALQADGKNGFGMLPQEDVKVTAYELASQFATDLGELGTSIGFDSSLFLS